MKTVTQTNSPGWIKKKFHDFGMGEMFAPLAVDRLEEDDALLSKALIDLHVLHHYPLIRTAKNVMSVVAAANQVTLGDNIVFAVGGVVFSTHDQDRTFVIPDNMTVFLRAEVDSTCGDLVASASTQDGTLTPLARKQVCAFTLAEGAETDSEGVGGGASSPTSMRILKAVKGAAGSVPTITLYANNGHAIGETSQNPSTPIATTYVVAPAQYNRDIAWSAKPVSVAADRYTLLSPNKMLVNVDEVGLYLSAQVPFDLSLAATWDSTATDYTVAANRAGKDFYVYACSNAGALKLLVSANTTYPVGYTATTSRKLGGFHCLCMAVGTIVDHAASDYLAGDIIPTSVWDLKFRPSCAPEGMRYVAGMNVWQDIYLASVSGGQLVSTYGGITADGASNPLFDWYDFTEWFGRIGKRLPFQGEFMAGANGANEGTNISGSADPATTGGHNDTAGRRMISNTFGEDYCGALCQWLIEAGGGAGTAAFKNQYSARTAQRGQGYQEPNHGLVGGHWSNGAASGSRLSAWNNGPLILYANFGARGVAEPLAVSL
jgi:hypothetical protein